LDAVLLDNVLAERRRKTTPGLTIQPDSVATSHYVGVFAPANAALRDRADHLLKAAMRDGSSSASFESGASGTTTSRGMRSRSGGRSDSSHWWCRRTCRCSREPAGGGLSYVPALLRASVVTVVLSCVDGVGRGARRAHRQWPCGHPALRGALVGYVEVIRGTPVLLQLFVLYYGIAAAIRLPAFAAAFLGLALNYAA
jgi:polar amino acid transport system substrate-binding protein